MGCILVVEDNPPSLMLMTYLLGKAGHAVSSAVNGAEGLDAVRKERPDLVVMDVQMPVVDGFEAARILKLDPDLRAIPLVAVTAVAMVGDRERVLAAGFDGYITKPIVPEAFVEQVESFLDPTRRSTPRQPVSGPDSGSLPETAGRSRRTGIARQASVLVVDNMSENRIFLRSALEPFGFRLSVATNVQDALALAGEQPDLILSDVHMPDGDGWDLVAAIRADPRLAHIPVALISSATLWFQRNSQRARELGVADLIQRPVGPEELVERLVALLPAEEA